MNDGETSGTLIAMIALTFLVWGAHGLQAEMWLKVVLSLWTAGLCFGACIQASRDN